MRLNNPPINRQTVAPIAIGGLGIVLVTISLFDVITDVIEGEGLGATGMENIPPLVLSIALIWVSHWLATRKSDRRYIYTVVRWTGLLFIITVATIIWIETFRHFQKDLNPIFVVADILAVVTLFGAIIGVYDAERSETQEELVRESDRRDALIQSLADAIAEVKVTTEGDVRLLESNSKYRELFPKDTGPLPEEILETVLTRGGGGTDSPPVDGGIIEQEVTRETEYGERDFRVRSVPIEHNEDTQRRYVVYTDLSDTRAVERELDHVQNQLNTIADFRQIATNDDRPPERLGELLRAARDTIGTNVGMFLKSVTDDDHGRRYEVVAATEEAPVNVGDHLGEESELLRRLSSAPVRKVPSENFADLPGNEALDRDQLESGSPLSDYETFIGGEIFVDGELYGVSCFAGPEDLTLDKNDEVVVHQANRALGSVIDRWELLQELREYSDRLEVVASTVSHDFKGPISVITGSAQQAAEVPDDDEFDDLFWECLERVERGAERMNGLTEVVTRMAREGLDATEIKAIELGRASRSVWETVDTGAAELIVQDEEEVVHGDRSRVKQLLENLFRNAVEHGGPNVTVEVGALDEGGFYVADDGEGFPDHIDPEEAFDRQRTGAADNRGLGLWLVEMAASAHDWDVTAGERESGGARIEIHTGQSNEDD